ncbi:gamma-tubulin complex component 2-like [Rhodnius prolixus]
MVEEDCNRKYLVLLEKEYEKAKGKKERLTVFKLKNVAEITNWSTKRPYLSSDFVDSSVSENTISTFNIPTASQENQLLSDLITCFLGGNSYYIQAEPLSNKNAIRTFKVLEGLDVKLQNLAEKCLKLAEYYSQLCRFIDDNRLLSVGRVNQALVSALDVTLLEYKNFIVQLEKLHLEQTLSLHELWFQIQDVLQTLSVLSNIASDISKKQLRGGATLTYLLEQRFYFSDTASEGEIIKYLTKKAAEPYMQSVKEWIFNGIIFDPFDEFMITEKLKSSFKECQTLEYWEKRYQIRKSYMPSFLEPVSNEILKSGVYLNVIRENKLSSGKAKLAPIEELKFSWKKSKYLDVIRKAYTHSSSHLLNHMMDEYQLWNRFVFMKKYFLVQQGDFIVQVLDLCNEELSKVILEVVPSRLETLVDMAIKGAESCIRDDLTVALQPQDLWHQVSKILSVSSTLEQKRESPNLTLTGYESFTLNMNCQWPLSLIFNARIISCYQMLFRLLFYTKHIEQLLFKVWIIDQQLRKYSLHKKKQYSVIFSLRHKMIYFIQNMQYYMMEEAIEPNWIEFQQQIKQLQEPVAENLKPSQFDLSNTKIYSVDDLLNVHKQFLDKCINDCLLSNSTLFPIFMTLLGVCKEFVTVVIQYEDHITNMLISEEDNFTKTVLEIEKQFQKQYVLFLTTIADFAPSDVEATKILEILNRANFNFYFNSQLDNKFLI